MNKLNYASLEACERLRDAGILRRLPVFGDRIYNKDFRKEGFVTAPVLTSSAPGAYQVFFDDGLIGYFFPDDLIILYSMAEVWRELQPYTKESYMRLGLEDNSTFVEIAFRDCSAFRNTNPTDALIDLLIFIRRIAT